MALQIKHDWEVVEVEKESLPPRWKKIYSNTPNDKIDLSPYINNIKESKKVQCSFTFTKQGKDAQQKVNDARESPGLIFMKKNTNRVNTTNKSAKYKEVHKFVENSARERWNSGIPIATKWQ